MIAVSEVFGSQDDLESVGARVAVARMARPKCSMRVGGLVQPKVRRATAPCRDSSARVTGKTVFPCSLQRQVWALFDSRLQACQ